uniref:G-protein coupled receptors family 1 profile domain-containing protein n=1 Tax=Gorilla gorilla gorilla TaxID=9595 RepID=A0A2I2Y418_GORGO
MFGANLTTFHPTLFILLGIPGLEQYHIWLSILFYLMYITAVLGNGALILVVLSEHTLHVFLSMLAGTDILLSTTTVPKALAIFWVHAGEIAFDACITQMFFIHVAFVAESGILLAMAFDSYVAICTPLRYTTILTPMVIGKMTLRLPYSQTNIIPHSYLPMASVLVDVAFIGFSYTLILQAVFRLPSQDSQHKALNTCVILLFFIPSFFTFLTHHFGKNIPHHVHILLANLYVLTKQIRDSTADMLSVVGKS